MRTPQHYPPNTTASARPMALVGLVRALQQPRVIMLCALVYLASLLWYTVASPRVQASTTSDPNYYYLGVVWIPYGVYMICKLLRMVRAMEATEYSHEQQAQDQEDDESTTTIQDTMNVVGDLSIYVIGMLLLCYVVVPLPLTLASRGWLRA